MSRETTAIVLIGSKTTSPWGDPLTRPTHLLRFTENSVPGWQIHPLNGATGVQDEPSYAGTSAAILPRASLMDDALVLVAALVLRDRATMEHPAVGSAARNPEQGGGILIPDAGFPEDVVDQAAEAVAECCQLWLIPVSPRCSLLGDESIPRLRGWGIEVDVMTSDAHTTLA